MIRPLLPIATFALLSLPVSAGAASPLSLHSRFIEDGQEPSGEAPATTEPGTDAPAGTDMPGTDAPGTDMPGSDAPGAEEPTEPTPPEGEQPAEGPDKEESPSEGDEYASSKEAGKGLSGEERTWKGAPSDTETVGVEKEKNLTHLMTGQVGAAFGVGWGMATAGDKYCGEFSTPGGGDSDGRKSVCTGMVPAFLDLSVGFGASKRVDVVVAVRINMMKRDYDDSGCDGLEACSDEKGLFLDSRGIGVLPGVRLWGKDNDKIFKVGGAIDLLYMFENFDGYRNRPAGPDESLDEDNSLNEDAVSDHILGLRGGPIIQIDPHHNVGIFIIPAAVPSFRPGGEPGRDSGWFEIGFEGSVGLQARFP